MPKSRKKPRRPPPSKPRDGRRDTPAETQGSDAITVAWTVSVTMVLICDLLAAGMHVFVRIYPDVRSAILFKELALYAAAVIGLVSLGLALIVYRVRRSPPPTGFAVFSACVAAAPILSLLIRSLR